MKIVYSDARQRWFCPTIKLLIPNSSPTERSLWETIEFIPDEEGTLKERIRVPNYR